MQTGKRGKLTAAETHNNDNNNIHYMDVHVYHLKYYKPYNIFECIIMRLWQIVCKYFQLSNTLLFILFVH